MLQASTAVPDRTWSGWVIPLALFLGAAALYSINLGHLPHPDELYHILAAKGMLATGEPTIAEGQYTRTLFFTWLVARCFALFGESLSVARLPALLPMAALAPLLFVWLRRVADTRAAWLGTLLFALSPFAVDIAQFCRFYGLQMLSLFAAAVCIFEAAQPGAVARRLVLAVLAAACALLAIYLQPTTLLGLVGLGLWLAGLVLLPFLSDRAVAPRLKLLVVAGLAAAACLALLALWVVGLLSRALGSLPLDPDLQPGHGIPVLVLPRLVQPALPEPVADDSPAGGGGHRRQAPGRCVPDRGVRRRIPAQLLRRRQESALYRLRSAVPVRALGYRPVRVLGAHGALSAPARR